MTKSTAPPGLSDVSPPPNRGTLSSVGASPFSKEEGLKITNPSSLLVTNSKTSKGCASVHRCSEYGGQEDDEHGREQQRRARDEQHAAAVVGEEEQGLHDAPEGHGTGDDRRQKWKAAEFWDFCLSPHIHTTSLKQIYQMFYVWAFLHSPDSL